MLPSAKDAVVLDKANAHACRLFLLEVSDSRSDTRCQNAYGKYCFWTPNRFNFPREAHCGKYVAFQSTPGDAGRCRAFQCEFVDLPPGRRARTGRSPRSSQPGVVPRERVSSPDTREERRYRSGRSVTDLHTPIGQAARCSREPKYNQAMDADGRWRWAFDQCCCLRSRLPLFRSLPWDRPWWAPFPRALCQSPSTSTLSPTKSTWPTRTATA
jgi:hypothetical protein